MFVRIALDQFVIVDKSALEFGSGLNVLSGETGAGKSILIDALGLITGGRSSTEWIRAGQPKLVIEAAVDIHDQPDLLVRLDDAGIPVDEDQVLLLRREVSTTGKSRCFANGRQVLVSQLRDWTTGLIWIVGQGEQRALLATSQQEQLLDRLGKSLQLAVSYRETRRRYLESRQQLEQLRREEDAYLAEAEWLRFQAQEIRDAAVETGERESLRSQLESLKNREQVEKTILELESRLHQADGSVADHLESLLHAVGELDGARWRNLEDRLLQLRESVRELRKEIPNPNEDGELSSSVIEERLRFLERLCKKYGGDEEAVARHLESVEAKIDDGDEIAAKILRASDARESIRKNLFSIGEKLSKKRKKAAKGLADQIGPELSALGMPGAAIRFQFDRDLAEDSAEACAPMEGGLDRISARFQSHGSIEWGDLGRVASGGELSRVLLAMQAILGEGAPPGTWVFDEVDQGIGGDTARKVGSRLARMSKQTQVLLVTHLPAIAALADHHFRVIKQTVGKRPIALVEKVEGDARLGELARMLSGDQDSAIARQHAQELMEVNIGDSR